MPDSKRPVYSEQIAAWSYYGLPPNVVRGTRDQEFRPVGEVGYVIGWISDQLSRLEWRVRVDGNETWTVEIPGGEKVRSSVSTGDRITEPEDPRYPVTASKRLLDLITWTPTQVKLLAANLFVAGECHYCANADDTWTVISVVKPKRDELIEKAAYAIRALWPHPADPDVPGAPLFAALPVLANLDWLTRLSESQSSNRVGMRGIVGLADGMATASGNTFWDDLKVAMTENMASPDNAAPVVLKGPAELVEPAGSGMKGLAWIVPEFPYDDKIDEKIAKAQLRLAYTLPIPPEILTGLQAQSRATAYQVEDNAYRGHIEPPARLIATVAAKALTLLLDRKITVEPDPTALLARKHSVSDVLEAFDRGAVSLAYLRSVVGIPQHAAATPEDLDLLLRLKGRSDAQATPDDSVPDSTEPAPSQQSVDGRLLAALTPETRTLLAEIGPERAYLVGAAAQATDRARERLGAMARTHEALRAELAPEVPNAQVAAALGLDRLRSAGVDVEGAVRHGLHSLTHDSPELALALERHVMATLEDDYAPPFTLEAS